MKTKTFSLLILLIFTSVLSGFSQTGLQNFISRKGNKLMDGGKEFRFLSINMPTLNYNEDEFEFTASQQYSLPDEFEIRDAFETYKQLGGKVMRIYTVPVRMDKEPKDVPTYVEAPGVFNEESFKTMDLVLSYANKYHVRVIFPIVNNWESFGGRPQYAGFRNKNSDDFWTDPQLKEDIKKTIEYVLNRKNTITGVAYKDDKSILCWETGNELRSPEDWTREICRYIKSIDKNHLVMDGFYAIDNQTSVQEYSLEEDAIDIVSSHHYDGNPVSLLKSVEKNLSIIKDRKPYLIGEIGFSSTVGTEKVFDSFIANKAISGALVWGLRNHRSEGGFYWHSEGDTRFKSYQWPGFESANEYDGTNFIHMLRRKAFEISGLEVPPIPVPKVPELLPISNPAFISWKGSMGASAYDIYRSESVKGPWKIIGYNVDDASTQYYPLFSDASARVGKTYFYKITAKNSAGSSAMSAVSNPVKVINHVLVDNMENYANIIYTSGQVSIATSDDRKYKEDMFRVKCDAKSELVYYVPGTIEKVKIYSFCNKKCNNLDILVSTNDSDYQKLDITPKAYYGNGEFYQVPLLYSLNVKITGNRYLKIAVNEDSQIGRVEIFYK